MTTSTTNDIKAKPDWYVYIVRCADNTLYTGVSTNVLERVATHNDGRGAKYTRARLPVRLVYSETAADRSSAQQREYVIKQLSPVKKRALAASGPTLRTTPGAHIDSDADQSD